MDKQVALAPVSGSKVYRVTSDHEVTVGSALAPPNRPSTSEQQREEDAAVHETPPLALPSLPRSEVPPPLPASQPPRLRRLRRRPRCVMR
eukprot:3197745-Rhodomonas_salina.1